MIKIIAEAGCNFRNMNEAKEFIIQSRYLKLFATKFQVFDKKLIYNNPHKDFLEKIILTKEKCEELFYFGQEIGQEVFFTPMYDCISSLEDIGVHYYKIRYGDRHNRTILDPIINTSKPFFRSQDLFFTEEPNQISLFCSAKYPSRLIDYPFSVRYGYHQAFKGISNHVGLELLKLHHDYGKYEYHEVHCKLDNTTPLENAWSVSFSELKEVLNK